MKILGISAFYHDSAAALVIDGKIIAAAQEERFTRIKHTAAFPTNAIKFCLDFADLTVDQIDAVVFYDKPLLKFERLLETYYAFAPKGLRSFLKSVPLWLNEKLFLKRQLRKGIKALGNYNKKKLRLLFTEHHLAHAASAYYPSSFKQSAILTIDGVGEWCTASMAVAHDSSIRIIREMNFPHSVGLLYSAFTYYLGFTVNSGEYKVMGLAPYGNANDEKVNKYIALIKEKIVNIKDDGSVWLNQHFFNYATGLNMTHNKRWEQLFGFKRRAEDDEILQVHCDLACAIQKITEEIVVKMARELNRLSGCKNLCLAGGVALNCVANGKLRELGIFENIFIQPAAGDAGGALGAALAASNLYFEEPRVVDEKQDQMQGSYLGPDFSDTDIEIFAKKAKAVYNKLNDADLLYNHVAGKIHEGKIVGWFQGRMEFGPRALGNRSILANATLANTQKTLNLGIKYREGFRPFAPSVLNEFKQTYFDLDTDSPYMLMVAQVKDNYRLPLPQNFKSLSLFEKLYCKRSKIPPVTHIDFTSRVQTVHKHTNYTYWKLLHAYYTISGTALIVNTSFNVRGEPIVCTPKDAYHCFMNTGMDVLVMNNLVFEKTDQPEWDNRKKWKMNFKKD